MIEFLKPERLPWAIAIDGPAASGKTTIGRMLAEYLDYLLLDTGCMYRAVTLAVLINGKEVDDEKVVVDVAHKLEIEILPVQGEKDGRLYTVLLSGEDVTWKLRSPDVDVNVSQVSAYQGVRKNLVQRQRAIGIRGRVVMVGRDIGTVVLPDAPLKLYITATPEERARRRYEERKHLDDGKTYDQILADIIRRDQFDGNRVHSPMHPADDAVLIDTTDRSLDQVLEEILACDLFHRN